MMGYEPKAIPEGFTSTNVQEVEERMKLLRYHRQEALAAYELARQKMAELTRRNFKPFKKGQKV